MNDGRPVRTPHRARTLALAGTLAGLTLVLLVGLGVWQVERLGWKLRLIEAVNTRVHAPPVPAPGPSAWSALTADADEYRHVTGHGRYLAGKDTLVQAVTERGPGYWVLTPFATDAGFTVLVNRGFVPDDERNRPGDWAVPAGERAVSGLLRMSEPGGGFLRANDPAREQWHSRDVAAIAAARGVTGAAPYFIDAEAGPDPQALPVGGLTVIDLPNNHLVYALTWFVLAAMLLGGIVLAVREEWRARHPSR